MNRIESLLQARFASDPNDLTEAYAPPQLQREVFPYNQFSPLHYEKNYSYPLIVWLHASHSDEMELTRLMPYLSLRNFVAIAPRSPQATAGQSTAGQSTAGQSTPGQSSGSGEAWEQSPNVIFRAQRRILDCIDIATRQFNIAPQRIFLMGYGEGGTMAIRIALSLATDFAGAISINGPLPKGDMPLARINEVRGVPLLLAQGAESQAYSTEQTCRDLRLVHAAGMSVDLRQYPCDDLHSQMLHDANAWIMNQIATVIR